MVSGNEASVMKKSTARIWALVVTVFLAIPLINGTAAAASAAPAHAPVVHVSPAHVAGNPHPKDCCHITIPSNYVYNPSGSHPTLHDYCTKSPDEFSAPGTNANFRGACARHDMCYQYHQKTRTGCDNQLGSQLDQECTYTYTSWYDVRRGACRDTALIYWAAVTLNTAWTS
jgi:hypothetical protein